MKLFTLAFFTFLLLTSPLVGQIQDFPQGDFKKADSIAQLYPDHSLDDLKTLSHKLTSPLASDVEKFRSIYTWVCLNIENDYPLFYRNQQNRKKLSKNPEGLDTWNKKFSIVAFKTLRDKRSTVCTGYAYLLHKLASYAGIRCLIVDGYGRTAQSNIGGQGIPNHSWNAVQLNNKWYLCDATWSSGAIDTQQKKFVQHYNDSYFLLDPALFVRNHYPLDTTKMFLQHGPTLTEFLNRPLIYNSIFPYSIRQLYPETFEVSAKKGEPVSFQFSKNDRVIEKVELSIKGPTGISSVYPSIYQGVSGLTAIDHTFTSKGTHIVHILLNNDYAFTYSVKVK